MEPPISRARRTEDTCCLKLISELQFKPVVYAKWKSNFLFLENPHGPLHILHSIENGIYSRIEHSSWNWNVQETQGFMEWKVPQTDIRLLLVVGGNATLTFFEKLPQPSFCLPYKGDGRLLNLPGSSHRLAQFNNFLVDMCTTPEGRYCCVVSYIHVTHKNVLISTISFVSYLEVDSNRLYLNWKDKILFGACENRLVAWSENLNCIQKNYQHTDTITSIIHASNDTIITASKDKTIRIWNPDILACVRILNEEEEFRNLFEWNGYLASQVNSGIRLRHYDGSSKGFVETTKFGCGTDLQTVMWNNHLMTWNESKNRTRIWTGYFEWKQARVVLIGWKKNSPQECNLAKLPKDILQVILQCITEGN